MIRTEHIRERIQELINESDQFVVDIQVSAGNEIAIEIDAMDRFITVKDCIIVSKGLENQLDREAEDFSLQVSSPGLSNPFKVKKQYIKNIGREVRVLKSDGIVLKGVLSEATEDDITITTKSKEKIEGRKAKHWVETQNKLNYQEIKETTIIISFK